MDKQNGTFTNLFSRNQSEALKSNGAIPKPDGRSEKASSWSIADVSDELAGKTCIFGVGRPGCKTINYIAEKEHKGITLMALDADENALFDCSCQTRFKLREVPSGSEREAAFEESLKKTMAFIKDFQRVYIVCGLGGVVGSEASVILAKLARNQGILVKIVASYPFSFEGSISRRNADRLIEKVKPGNIPFKLFSNDDLLSDIGERESVAESLQRMNEWIYQHIIKDMVGKAVDFIII
ncbi:MAG: hypothetical protein IJU50_05375 [Lachnospiraceae bacterium]|nr:hypothetical protein [Lachnospiraceae bacterium]